MIPLDTFTLDLHFTLDMHYILKCQHTRNQGCPLLYDHTTHNPSFRSNVVDVGYQLLAYMAKIYPALHHRLDRLKLVHHKYVSSPQIFA